MAQHQHLHSKIRQSVHQAIGTGASISFSVFSGEPDKTGYLMKQGGLVKSWKKRWFVLKENFLYYFKSPQTIVDTKGAILLDNAIAQRAQLQMKKTHPGFTIATPSRLYSIITESEREADEWISAINKAATARDKNISVHATMTYILVVKGIMCKCCHSSIKEIIYSFPGVQDVVVDGDEELVTISGTDLNVNLVMEKLEDIGYLPYLPPGTVY